MADLNIGVVGLPGKWSTETLADAVEARTGRRLEELSHGPLDSRIMFMKAMGFNDYIKLQKNAKCVISDSGTIFEESALLNIPAVTIRQCHERPEGMDSGLLILSDIVPERLLDAIRIVLDQHARIDPDDQYVSDYIGQKVSVKVTRIIQSYTDYVKRTVWSE